MQFKYNTFPIPQQRGFCGFTLLMFVESQNLMILWYCLNRFNMFTFLANHSTLIYAENTFAMCWSKLTEIIFLYAT